MTPVEDRVVDEAGEELSKDRQFVSGLARGLAILRAFQPNETFLGNSQIAERTGLPRPTVSRLTYTLTQLGYLVRDPQFEKYRLGSAVLSLGYAALAGMDFRHVARPFMQEVADFSTASVALGERDRTEMIYIENCRGTGSLTLRLDVGSRLPIAATSMGRAYIAGLNSVERGQVLDELARQHGKDWPALRKRIDTALEQYADRGFVISAGEWRSEINGVGVPVVLPEGGTVLALNCGGASFLLSPERLEEIGPRLAVAARNIEQAVRRR